MRAEEIPWRTLNSPTGRAVHPNVVVLGYEYSIVTFGRVLSVAHWQGNDSEKDRTRIFRSIGYATCINCKAKWGVKNVSNSSETCRKWFDSLIHACSCRPRVPMGDRRCWTCEQVKTLCFGERIAWLYCFDWPDDQNNISENVFRPYHEVAMPNPSTSARICCYSWRIYHRKVPELS